MKKEIKEGLRVGDLEDTIDHLISIDEFESKIDNEEAIVVAFYAKDKEAALDFSRFIEKSEINILDTETPPTTDLNGKYVVFVEYKRNQKFVSELLKTIKISKDLTKIENYKFRAYKRKGTFEVTEEELKDKVRLEPVKPEEAEPTKESVIDYLKNSILDNATIVDNTLILERLGKKLEFEILGFSPQLKLFEHDVTFKYDFDSYAKTEKISRFLGANWNVLTDSVVYVLQRVDDNNVLILKQK